MICHCVILASIKQVSMSVKIKNNGICQYCQGHTYTVKESSIVQVEPETNFSFPYLFVFSIYIF